MQSGNWKFMRIIAKITIIIFALNSLGYASPSVYSVNVSESIGQVQQRWKSSDEKERTVIIIQDAHSNFSAQKNLAEIICELVPQLSQKGQTPFVGIEGAIGNYDLNKLRDFPIREAKEIVGCEYVKQGKFLGAELASILSERDFVLSGVENDSLLAENYQAFINVADKADFVKTIMAEYRDLIKNLKREFYSEKLKEIDLKVSAYRQGEVDVFDYVKTLFTSGFAEMLDVYAYINLAQLYEFLNNAQGSDKCSRLLSTINMPKLIQDVDQFNYDLLCLFAQNEKERTIIKCENYIELLSRILTLQATREDITAYYAHNINLKTVCTKLQNIFGLRIQIKNNIKICEDVLQKAEKFYEAAEKRDAFLLNNLLEEMTERGQSTGVIVAGGYHTESLVKLCREQGVSYAVVTPHLNTTDCDINYMGRMMGDIAPLNPVLASHLNISRLNAGAAYLYGKDAFEAIVNKACLDTYGQSFLEKGEFIGSDKFFENLIEKLESRDNGKRAKFYAQVFKKIFKQNLIKDVVAKSNDIEEAANNFRFELGKIVEDVSVDQEFIDVMGSIFKSYLADGSLQAKTTQKKDKPKSFKPKFESTVGDIFRGDESKGGDKKGGPKHFREALLDFYIPKDLPAYIKGRIFYFVEAYATFINEVKNENLLDEEPVKELIATICEPWGWLSEQDDMAAAFTKFEQELLSEMSRRMGVLLVDLIATLPYFDFVLDLLKRTAPGLGINDKLILEDIEYFLNVMSMPIFTDYEVVKKDNIYFYGITINKTKVNLEFNDGNTAHFYDRKKMLLKASYYDNVLNNYLSNTFQGIQRESIGLAMIRDSSLRRVFIEERAANPQYENKQDQTVRALIVNATQELNKANLLFPGADPKVVNPFDSEITEKRKAAYANAFKGFYEVVRLNRGYEDIAFENIARIMRNQELVEAIWSGEIAIKENGEIVAKPVPVCDIDNLDVFAAEMQELEDDSTTNMDAESNASLGSDETNDDEYKALFEKYESSFWNLTDLMNKAGVGKNKAVIDIYKHVSHYWHWFIENAATRYEEFKGVELQAFHEKLAEMIELKYMSVDNVKAVYLFTKFLAQDDIAQGLGIDLNLLNTLRAEVREQSECADMSLFDTAISCTDEELQTKIQNFISVYQDLLDDLKPFMQGEDRIIIEYMLEIIHVQWSILCSAPDINKNKFFDNETMRLYADINSLFSFFKKYGDVELLLVLDKYFSKKSDKRVKLGLFTQDEQTDNSFWGITRFGAYDLAHIGYLCGGHYATLLKKNVLMEKIQNAVKDLVEMDKNGKVNLRELGFRCSIIADTIIIKFDGEAEETKIADKVNLAINTLKANRVFNNLLEIADEAFWQEYFAFENEIAQKVKQISKISGFALNGKNASMLSPAYVQYIEDECSKKPIGDKRFFDVIAGIDLIDGATSREKDILRILEAKDIDIEKYKRPLLYDNKQRKIIDDLMPLILHSDGLFKSARIKFRKIIALYIFNEDLSRLSLNSDDDFADVSAKEFAKMLEPGIRFESSDVKGLLFQYSMIGINEEVDMQKVRKILNRVLFGYGLSLKDISFNRIVFVDDNEPNSIQGGVLKIRKSVVRASSNVPLDFASIESLIKTARQNPLEWVITREMIHESHVASEVIKEVFGLDEILDLTNPEAFYWVLEEAVLKTIDAWLSEEFIAENYWIQPDKSRFGNGQKGAYNLAVGQSLKLAVKEGWISVSEVYQVEKIVRDILKGKNGLLKSLEAMRRVTDQECYGVVNMWNRVLEGISDLCTNISNRKAAQIYCENTFKRVLVIDDSQEGFEDYELELMQKFTHASNFDAVISINDVKNIEQARKEKAKIFFVGTAANKAKKLEDVVVETYLGDNNEDPKRMFSVIHFHNVLTAMLSAANRGEASITVESVFPNIETFVSEALNNDLIKRIRSALNTRAIQIAA